MSFSGIGGTLSGDGNINTAVIVTSGNTLAPGNSIESLGTGAVAFNGSSSYAYEINTSTVSADLLYSSGALSIANGTNLTINDLGLNSPLVNGTTFTLISYVDASSSWTGGSFTYDSTTLADGDTFTLGSNLWLFDYNALSGGGNFTADQSGATRYVTMTVVPESSSAFLYGLGMLVLLRRRRDSSNSEPLVN